MSMKKLIFCVLLTLPVLFIGSCKKDNTIVRGNLPTEDPDNPVVTVPANIYVYGNYFRVRSSSSYETLMASCRRCGLKRFFNLPGGSTVYQRFWTWDDTDPKRCENWNNQGYIQIEFQEKRLPTKAKVSIRPKYTGARPDYWGEPFEITTEAKAINENEGFQILVRPTDGLGGVYTLDIRSEYSNHVLDSDLAVTVTYGQHSREVIISETLEKLSEKAIKPTTLDIDNCDTYTN